MKRLVEQNSAASGKGSEQSLSYQQSLLEQKLKASGMLREDGFTIYGQQTHHVIGPGHEPEACMAATTLQRRLVACAYATPSPGRGLCASWVEQAFSRLGLGVVRGDAASIYAASCRLTDLADLKVGMVVAVDAHPWTMEGRVHGHVGLYIGDEKVMECVDDCVRTVPLPLWLDAYGVMSEVRWGWLGSIPLA